MTYPDSSKITIACSDPNVLRHDQTGKSREKRQRIGVRICDDRRMAVLVWEFIMVRTKHKSETFAIDSSVDLSTTSHHHPRQMASSYHAPPTPLSHGPDQPPVSLPKVGQTRCCKSLGPGRSHPSIILLSVLPRLDHVVG